MQSRNADARAMVQPALDYYRGEQQAGAQETSFRSGYACALYVSSLAANDGTARRTALDAAARLLDGASQEARNLSDLRELASLIAAARMSQHG